LSEEPTCSNSFRIAEGFCPEGAESNVVHRRYDETAGEIILQTQDTIASSLTKAHSEMKRLTFLHDGK
jgi:hypothetical protein